MDADEVLIIIETDKVSVDVRSPTAGKIVSIAAAEDETVEVGAPLFEIEEGAAGAATVSAPATSASTAAADSGPAEKAASSTEVPASSPSPPTSSPSAPRPAASSSSGSGGDTASASAIYTPREESRSKMSPMRKAIARNLKASQNENALLTTFNEVDMTAATEIRKKYKDLFQETHDGTRLGFMSFFLQAVSAALQEEPAVNSRIDSETNEIITPNYVDISVAAASPRGLVMPVLRDVDKLDFVGTEELMGTMANKARNNELSLEEMTGGTFTISNGGVFGSLMGTPIVNIPQSCILGMHAIKPRPVSMPDGEYFGALRFVAIFLSWHR